MSPHGRCLLLTFSLLVMVNLGSEATFSVLVPESDSHHLHSLSNMLFSCVCPPRVFVEVCMYDCPFSTCVPV